MVTEQFEKVINLFIPGGRLLILIVLSLEDKLTLYQIIERTELDLTEAMEHLEYFIMNQLIKLVDLDYQLNPDNELAVLVKKFLLDWQEACEE
ncbi:MAG: hypothetical protein ACTSRC_18775 [Candidatus Helarchaeota archaeon]